MKITKLEYQKKDPSQVDIFVDGKFVAAVGANDVIKLGIYNGQEITAQEFNKILEESEFGKLFNSALNFLSFRPRSEWEIKEFFRRKRLTNSSLIENVITKLRQIGQINDLAFAKWFINQRRTFKPLGERALKYELLKKGLDRKVIDAALIETDDQNGEAISELGLALKALDKKSQRIINSITDSKSKFEAKVKLQRILLSRGFSYDIAREAVEKSLKKEYNPERS